MPKKQIIIDAPKHPIVRYRFTDDRHMQLDLRGIRNPHSPFNGRLQPAKGSQKRYLSPEHMQCMVDEYFESCNGPLIDKYGSLVYDKQGNLVKTQVRPCTVSGLALYLGLKTETLRNYTRSRVDTILDEMRAETNDTLTFSIVIQRAKQRIEAYAEGRLYDHEGQRGAQFVLDNVFHWISNKEQADIEKARADTQLRRDEFELKKRLLDEGVDDDNITINIVRAGKDNDDE